LGSRCRDRRVVGRSSEADLPRVGEPARVTFTEQDETRPPERIGRQEEDVAVSRPQNSGQVAPEEVEDRTTGGGAGSKVFLFNCECHTFEEVITQLLKAVPGMTRPLAEELAWRVHNTGLAEVYRGGPSDCDRVAKILGETGLIVQVL
jgi:ATP-dependent Clp protease adaptor protein ClpS